MEEMALAQQVPNLGLARFSVQDKSILITGATGSLGRVAEIGRAHV